VADWRLCGFVSRLLLAAHAQGEPGEAILSTTHGRLRAGRLLLIGLGPRARFGVEAHASAVEQAVRRLLDLGVGTAVFDLPAPLPQEAIEDAARGLVEGACAVLDQRPARFMLRVVAHDGGAGRLRAALEQAAVSHPRGATSLRMVRPPAAGPVTGAGLPRLPVS
jgi:hypothetical protein